MNSKKIYVLIGSSAGVFLYLAGVVWGASKASFLHKLYSVYVFAVPALISRLLGASQPIHFIGFLLWGAIGAIVGVLISMGRHPIYRLTIFVGFNIVWVVFSAIAMFFVGVFTAP